MAEPFKEKLNADAVERMAAHLERVWPAFPKAEFVADATAGLSDLELMARVSHVSQSLRPHLPSAFEEAVAVLVDALGEHAQDGTFDREKATGISGFPLMAVTRFVADFGLGHFEASMTALHAMTQRMTAEFDIRPFLAHHPEATWARLEEWTTDASPHVRRLTSEGTRPRLPWGKRIPGVIEAPERGLAILERLKTDPERYVQRSVANHLNDVSKDHPDRVLDIGRRWLGEAESNAGNQAWIVRHSLRSRLKAADPKALSLFGYPDPPVVEVVDFKAAETVDFTGKLPFSFGLLSGAQQTLLVDYVVHYVKANGTRKPKVFRIADRAIGDGQQVRYDRGVDFKPITTRKHYAGVHRVEVRVNGKILAGAEFELRPA